MFKEIFLYDILMLFIGLLIVFSTIQSSIYNAFISHKKVYLYPIILGAVLILVSSFMLFDRLGRSEYNLAPSDKYEIVSETKEFPLNDSTIIERSNLHGEYELILNDKVSVGKMQIVYSYYRNMSDVNIYQITRNNKEYYYINNYDNDFKTSYSFFMETLKNFSKNKNYNYDELKKAEVIVYINPADHNKLDFKESE